MNETYLENSTTTTYKGLIFFNFACYHLS